MTSILSLTATVIVAALLSLLAINTTRFSSSPPFVAVRHLQGAGRTWKAEFIPIDSAVGPESFAFDPQGDGPYTGVSDGKIIKWQQDEQKWVDFAVTSPNRRGCEAKEKEEETEDRCGRPLGLRFSETNGDLYIADAYMGLLSVGRHGGLANEVASFQTQDLHPLTFTNGLDIDQTSGAVYFTDSSSIYQRRDFVAAILSGDETGRLLKYEPKTKRVDVLMNNLSFPNGVSLSNDGDFLLVAETTKCRILKYWLKTKTAGTSQVLADLPGFPDNIKASSRGGGFWVGIHSRKLGFLKLVLRYPWIGKAVVKVVSVDVVKRVYSYLGAWIGSGGMGIRVSDEGKVMEMIEGKDGFGWRWSISEVEEREDGVLWIGSINTPFAAKLNVCNYTRSLSLF